MPRLSIHKTRYTTTHCPTDKKKKKTIVNSIQYYYERFETYIKWKTKKKKLKNQLSRQLKPTLACMSHAITHTQTRINQLTFGSVA